MKSYFGVVLMLLGSIAANSAHAEQINISRFDAPFRVSKHSVISDRIILEQFDERCRQETGNDTTLDTDIAISSVEGFSAAINVYDLSYLRCSGWKNEWELGVMSLGSGGGEWAISIGDEYIVRVRALNLDIDVFNSKDLVIFANVHPVYCESKLVKCVKEFRLSVFD